ncbi:MAG: TolC family protein [Muribaculaceae bacterium]|nr:TolC family protein [Muribaculaceae bacterium]
MKAIYYTLIISLLPTAIAAQDIDSYAREIALRNPEVLAAKHNYESQIEGFRADNTLEGLEVDFGYKFSNVSNDDNKWGISVGQSFDWPGVYSARKKSNTYRAEAFENLYRGELLKSALEIKQLLLNAAVAQQKADILAEAQANIDRLTAAYNRAYEQGEATILEVKKLSLQSFEISSQYAKAQAEADAFKSTLKALNGNEEVVIPSHLDLPPLLPYHVYQSQLIENDPIVAANDKLQHSAAAEISAGRRSAMPSFKIAYTHDYEERSHFNGFSIGFSLPRWSNKHSIRAAKAAAEAMNYDEYSMRRNAEMSSDYALATRLASRVENAKAVFDNDDYTQVLTKALDGGKLNIFEYLREYNDYLEARAEYVELQGQLALALASLNRYNLLRL